MELTKYAIDEQREVGGIWVETSASGRLLVARAGNPRATAMFERLSKPYQSNRGGIPKDIEETLYLRVMARHILLGWEGVTEGGQPVEYSPEAAEKLLKKYKGFREEVLAYATNLDLFRAEQAKEIEKNS